MTNNDKFIVSWFKEDIDKDILSLKKPEIGKELTRFLEERNRRGIYKGYCHDYAYGCRKINKSKPDCWRFQNISKNPDRDSYYTQSGQLKKNKKIQKQYLDSLLASRERLGGIDYQHYNHKGGFVPNTWDNETFNKKVGREWLLEDKLDTKTLLRIYGGVRPTYEDSVKKSLDSMKR